MPTSYRVVGAFELALRPHHAEGTLVPVDLDALRAWALSLARDAGLEPCAVAADDHGVRMVAVASAPRAVLTLARWVPELRARPLHRAEDYYRLIAELRRG